MGDLDAIKGEDRVVLCEEPVEHFYFATKLGLERLVFNGVMASPAGHPFWAHVLATIRRSVPGNDDVIETTGPLMLSGSIATYAHPDQLAISSCHLFTLRTKTGQDSQAKPHGPHCGLRICDHVWHGSWLDEERTVTLPQKLKHMFYKSRYYATRGSILSFADFEKRVDQTLLASGKKWPEEDLPQIAVFMPVRDAEPFLDRAMELLLALDYPKDRLRLVFCEGDSVDGTRQAIADIQERFTTTFAGIELLTFTSGYSLDRATRLTCPPKLPSF
ncbi:glycosyltransferase family 2 protein [Halovulum sp. GXIMD14793]